ncbi:MAG TPA: acyltransferase domain-containing protein [Acidimicrobiales bacterium]|nr:acyltransferase domain-containing protein [Acidimicrobiales bacterium]
MPAFVFPGQGAQRVGMGRPWTFHPSWEIVEDASEASGHDIAHLLLDATMEELTETRNAQLATFTFTLVVLDAVERLGVEPTGGVAGHSVGEYSALAASGILGFEDSVRVVAERGAAMQAAADAQQGVMAIVDGCDSDTTDIACRLADGDVWVANFNSAEETVIAGNPDAVALAGAIAVGMGARRVTPVPVSGAFHTPFMEPARTRLKKILASTTFHDSDIPVVANVDARNHEGGAEWPRLLSAQLCNPVRWRHSVMRLGGILDRGADTEWLFLELGPGDSLANMIRQTLPSVTAFTVSVPADLDRLVETVSGTEAMHAFATGHQGEHLYVSERVVISPNAGIFEPATGIELSPGTGIEVGTLLGTVSGEEVRSPFAGRLEGTLAHPGERVQTGQPIVWLHAS